ncbi:unnamed protein product [Didymodactylos carnosus]|uniref:Uncharacterized protein n=1 Tax=Didymodactylos carnosus TaxID=1234261 RepID=A0A814VEK9_9BILA|nr:unnamed protein product [Didymodactylos carnosus]CAF3951621.1 unnamed protein product [Didymodactylos carnosus]
MIVISESTKIQVHFYWPLELPYTDIVMWTEMREEIVPPTLTNRTEQNRTHLMQHYEYSNLKPRSDYYISNAVERSYRGVPQSRLATAFSTRYLTLPSNDSMKHSYYPTLIIFFFELNGKDFSQLGKTARITTTAREIVRFCYGQTADIKSLKFGELNILLGGVAYLHSIPYSQVWSVQEQIKNSLSQMKYDISKSPKIKRGQHRFPVSQSQITPIRRVRGAAATGNNNNSFTGEQDENEEGEEAAVSYRNLEEEEEDYNNNFWVVNLNILFCDANIPL